jgi:hypothetical protein
MCALRSIQIRGADIVKLRFLNHLRYKRFLPLFIAPAILFAKGEVVPIAPAEEGIAPWFTGPLIAASATVIPGGHINFEPYLFYFNSPYFYDNDWDRERHITLQQVTLAPYLWIGLTKWADLQLLPVVTWRYRDGPSSLSLGDWSAKLEFQLYLSEIPHKNWLPSIKLGIQETFPTGKYRNLNPNKLFTDQTGQGAYTTNFQLDFARFLHFSGHHWMQFRLNLNWAISAPVHVKGLNSYGGGTGANGTVRPGQVGSVDFAVEYALTRNWVLACDFQWTCQGTSEFSGHPGVTPAGLPARDRQAASNLYVIAPAIEYNWSQYVGIIAGTQITLAGKNSNQYYSGVVAFNYYR